MKRFASSILVGVLFALTLTPANPSLKAASGKTIRIGLSKEIKITSSLQISNFNDFNLINAVFRGLLSKDQKTGEYINDLAEMIELTNNDTEIKVRLKKGIQFHNGEEVTAEDVAFTYTEIVKPNYRHLYYGFLGVGKKLKNVEAIDRYNLIIRFEEPYSNWKFVLETGIIPKKYFLEVGQEKFNEKPMGCGHFRFVEYKNDGSIVIKPINKNSGFDTLSFHYIPDETTRLAMLETGTLDLLFAVSPAGKKRLSEQNRFKIKTSPGGPSHFGIAFMSPALKDKNLRKAIDHAINRQDMINRVYLGEGYPLYHGTTKIELGHNPGFQTEFNPDKAHDLLKKSSYKPGTVLRLVKSNLFIHGNLAGIAIQYYLRNIGIPVVINDVESQKLFGYAIGKKKEAGDLLMYSIVREHDPTFSFFLFSGKGAAFNSNPQRENQVLLDDLIQKQSKETNEEKREAIVRQIHQLIRDDPYNISLFGLDMIYAMKKDIDYNWTLNS
ncbi:ABC transporter substrate-binding protein, partial [bacterium]|nr:ABC transporter substrate-binding protein [bacterium]